MKDFFRASRRTDRLLMISLGSATFLLLGLGSMMAVGVGPPDVLEIATVAGLLAVLAILHLNKRYLQLDWQVNALVKQAASPLKDYRIEAAIALDKATYPEALRPKVCEAFLQLAEDPEPDVRMAAVLVVGHNLYQFAGAERSALVSKIMEKSLEREDTVRYVALDAFSEVVRELPPSELDPMASDLIARLDSRNEETRRSAAFLLSIMEEKMEPARGDEAVERLLDIVRREATPNRWHVSERLFALRRFASRDSEERLRRLFHGYLGDIQGLAASASTDSKIWAARIPGLWPLEIPAERQAAILETLQRASRDGDAEIRSSAVSSLISISQAADPSVAREALLRAIDLMGDPDSELRQFIPMALSMVAPALRGEMQQLAVDATLRLLKDKESKVREDAAIALADLAKGMDEERLRPVLRALHRLGNDGDISVRFMSDRTANILIGKGDDERNG